MQKKLIQNENFQLIIQTLEPAFVPKGRLWVDRHTEMVDPFARPAANHLRWMNENLNWFYNFQAPLFSNPGHNPPFGNMGKLTIH